MGGGAAGVGCAAIQGYKQDQSKIVISGLGTNILQSVVILRNPIWLAFSENCIPLVFQKDSTNGANIIPGAQENAPEAVVNILKKDVTTLKLKQPRVFYI